MIVCHRNQSQPTYKLLFSGNVLRNVLILPIASLSDAIHLFIREIRQIVFIQQLPIIRQIRLRMGYWFVQILKL